jgi:RNA polymerase sigma-70 factor (ECF subfamily)
VTNIPEKEFLARIEVNRGILIKVSRLYMDTREDQEDLIQEIVLRLWSNYHQFEGKSSFSTWMYRVAVNTAITFLRKEKRQPILVTETENLPELRADDHASEQAQQMKIFYKAVQHLNSIEKALIFYFMEGLSHREIGSQLGITENNARVKLSRTKEKLQQIIKQLGYES